MSELIPVAWYECDAVVNGLLRQVEHFSPQLVVLSDERWHTLEMHCKVECWSVDPLQCHVVPTAEEEPQVWVVFCRLDPRYRDLVPLERVSMASRRHLNCVRGTSGLGARTMMLQHALRPWFFLGDRGYLWSSLSRLDATCQTLCH